MRLVKILCCAVALATCLVPTARADEWNKKTFLTFSGPVQIPGATLAAGTYVFRLADLNGNRHVVQVFDKDEKHIYGTILAIPDKRLEPTDDPVVLFAERPAGTPQAIRAWFYPGDTFGDEFVYPKSQAMKIAKATHKSVLAMDDSSSSASDNERMESMKSAKVGRVDENGAAADNDNNADQNRAPASGTSAAQSTTAKNTPAAEQNRPQSSASTTTSDDARLKNSSRTRATGTSGQTATNTADNNARRNTRRRLPQTASSLELMELLGGLSLAGAFAARRLRARFGEVR